MITEQIVKYILLTIPYVDIFTINNLAHIKCVQFHNSVR